MDGEFDASHVGEIVEISIRCFLKSSDGETVLSPSFKFLSVNDDSGDILHEVHKKLGYITTMENLFLLTGDLSDSFGELRFMDLNEILEYRNRGENQE